MTAQSILSAFRQNVLTADFPLSTRHRPSPECRHSSSRGLIQCHMREATDTHRVSACFWSPSSILMFAAKFKWCFTTQAVHLVNLSASELNNASSILQHFEHH